MIFNVAIGWYVVRSSGSTMNNAIFFLPKSSNLKSLFLVQLYNFGFVYNRNVNSADVKKLERVLLGAIAATANMDLNGCVSGIIAL